MVGVLVASHVVPLLLNKLGSLLGELGSMLGSKLGSQLGSELELLRNFNNDLEDMQSTLQSIAAVLNDAEKKSFNDEPVRLWLKKLKAAAYDIEDMFDEFQTQNWFDSPTMAHELKSMRKKLDKIAEDKDRYNLRVESIPNEQVFLGRSTFSVVDRADVLGRDKEATKIINQLLKPPTKDICIIPIVGIGGLGKTTLAQLIYNDDRIQKVFDLKIWVHAMDFKVDKLVEQILLSSGSETRNSLGNSQSGAEKVQKILKNKRYLIVLDDVWNEDRKEWRDFKPILQGGKKGSKILVTTRNERVSSIMDATETQHKLKRLSNDICSELFERMAFGSAGTKDSNLVLIGKDMVKKCKGVPLAANSLGGMLQLERGEAAWKKVRDSDLWELKDDDGGNSTKQNILPSLKLSYHYMLSPLKLCFVYFSSYPRAFKLEKDMLIKQWIAQRFIQTEQIGDSYVNYLLSISFLEEVKVKMINWFYENIPGILEEESNSVRMKEVKTYMKMHDLVYDLARWVAGGEVSDFGSLERGKANAMECRYASAINYKGASKELLEALPRKVRALHLKDCTSLPNEIFSHTKCLRVLDFTSYYHEELPTSVYDLKQLRYLQLRCDFTKVDERIGNIRTIPNSSNNLPTLSTSFDKLHNLIHLDLSFSTELLKLPDSIGGLQKLHSLKLYGCDKLRSLPESLGNLTELRTLDIRMCRTLNLDVLPQKICNMEYLNIQRDALLLELLKVDTSESVHGDPKQRVVRDVIDAKRINLKETGGSFKLLYYHCVRKNEQEVEAMLKALQPHQNLQELCIDCYRGSMFPSWMMRETESFLPNLIKIRLEGITNCEHLPVLGQLPKLEEIIIERMPKLRRISEEVFCGARNTTAGASFPSLKRLELHDMDGLEHLPVLGQLPNCEHLPVLGQLPKLEEIIIERMPKLRRISEEVFCGARNTTAGASFPSLKRLELHDMDGLEHLPVLGQLPKLEEIIIERMPKLRRISEEVFCGARNTTAGASFPSLKRLELHDMDGLEHLPVLGQLPKLEEIIILRMPKVRRISEEFCGARNTSADASFPSLKRLELRDMPELEEWVTAAMAEDDGERGASLFSCLEDLTIWDCFKLKTIHSSPFPCLEDLTIYECPKLRRIHPCIPPSVRRLSLSSIEHNLLTFVDVPNKIKYLKIRDYGLAHFRPSIRRLTSLETLRLERCIRLTTFPEWLGQLSQLQHLEILKCDYIDRLPQSIQSLTALTRLCITRCNQSLWERTRKEIGEDWDKISRIDTIVITRRRDYR